MKTYLMMLLALTVLVVGCGQKPKGQMQMPPAEVGIVILKKEDVSVSSELPGRLQAIRMAQVRARVTGIVLKQKFSEGSDVKAGDVLFEIDPAPFQAVVDASQAALTKAQANLAAIESKAKRFAELVKVHAVSEQEFDDISSLKLQAEAQVKAAAADLDTAKLNLGYATVTSPIDGRIGAAKVTEGALVNGLTATEMAVVQQLDPIYFNFTQASVDVLKLKQDLARGKLQKSGENAAKVSLILEDGSIYPDAGKLLFSDITVDPSTGMVTLRAEFPNHNGLLLPGMFGRCRIEQAVEEKALTAPQRGVQLGPNGTASVLVVLADNKVELRQVKLGQAYEDKWVIEDGLFPGEQIIVEGLQKAHPGSLVKPVPFK